MWNRKENKREDFFFHFHAYCLHSSLSFDCWSDVRLKSAVNVWRLRITFFSIEKTIFFPHHSIQGQKGRRESIAFQSTQIYSAAHTYPRTQLILFSFHLVVFYIRVTRCRSYQTVLHYSIVWHYPVIFIPSFFYKYIFFHSFPFIHSIMQTHLNVNVEIFSIYL